MADYPRSEVVLTEKIRRWIRTVLTTSNLPDDIRVELRKYANNRRSSDEMRVKTISFDLVKTVHRYLQEEQGGLYLHELLEGTTINLPQPVVSPKSPELEERLERLRTEQANKEYAEITRNVDIKQIREPVCQSVGAEVKSLNRHLMSILNFVITVCGSFVFAYKATEYAMTNPSFELQLCAGLVTASIVFMADLYFLIKHDV